MTNHKNVERIEDCDYCQWFLKKYDYRPESVWMSHKAHIEEARQNNIFPPESK